MGEVHYMISEAAKQVSVETHVLRYWEEELALSINRTEMGHRYYTEEDIQLFRCIKELKEQGMQLKELKELIPDMLRTRTQLQAKRKNAGAAENRTMLIVNRDEMLNAAADSKLLQAQNLISEILQNILAENNKLLGQSVSQAVSETVIKEMDHLLHIKELQEEERYKKLDHLIRQQQVLRKESARSTPIHRLRRLLET